jgi:hypothetical protein
MSNTLGDAPIQDKYRQQMQAMAATLDEFLNGDAKGANREAGFVLLVFYLERCRPQRRGDAHERDDCSV